MGQMLVTFSDVTMLKLKEYPFGNCVGPQTCMNEEQETWYSSHDKQCIEEFDKTTAISLNSVDSCYQR